MFFCQRQENKGLQNLKERKRPLKRNLFAYLCFCPEKEIRFAYGVLREVVRKF